MREFFDNLSNYFKENPIFFYILIGIVALLVIVIIAWIIIGINRSKKKKRDAVQKTADATVSAKTSSSSYVQSSAAQTKADENKETSALPAEKAAEPAKDSEMQEAAVIRPDLQENYTEQPTPLVLTKQEEKNQPLKTSDIDVSAEKAEISESSKAKENAEQTPKRSADIPKTAAKQGAQKQQSKAAETPGRTASKSAAEKLIGDRPAESSEDEDKKGAYTGKWLIMKNGDSYYFELRASNGERLLTSIDYTSVSGAKNGIKTHKNNILKDHIVISQNKKGQYFFKLLNGSKQLLCTGETYPSKAGCESAVESVKRFAESAVIAVQKEEETED